MDALLSPAEPPPPSGTHSQVWGAPGQPAGPTRHNPAPQVGVPQVPRLCSSPAPYLQCAHPKGEDVHGCPVGLLCRTKPGAHQPSCGGISPPSPGAADVPTYGPLSPHTSICACFPIPPPRALHKPSQLTQKTRDGAHAVCAQGTKAPRSSFPLTATLDTLLSASEPEQRSEVVLRPCSEPPTSNPQPIAMWAQLLSLWAQLFPTALISASFHLRCWHDHPQSQDLLAESFSSKGTKLQTRSSQTLNHSPLPPPPN